MAVAPYPVMRFLNKVWIPETNPGSGFSTLKLRSVGYSYGGISTMR